MPDSPETSANEASDQPMSAEQMVELKTLAWRAYELDAFKPGITSAEAQRRIVTLGAKIRLLDAPPHTL
jgi:hypothetical protein